MNKIDQAIAIDIGTSKIAIFINSKGRIQQIQLSESSDEFPCVIYCNNGIYFGNEALNRPHLNPMFLFRNLKCLIGRKFSEPYIQDIRKTATFNIVAGENDRVMVEVCENSQLILKDPTELLSMIVNYAIEKATARAKKNMVKIATEGTTIPHEVIGKFGKCRVVLLPSKEGSGVIAGGSVRPVVELCGIKDITAKIYGSRNKINCVRATLDGLMQLRSKEDIAALRGKTVEEIL